MNVLDFSLLSAAEHYLSTLDYDGCREHVLSSPQYHQKNITATQILTLISVLSNSTRPDSHYSVLSLERFSQNQTLIKTRFKTLATIINPNNNTLSLSEHAFSVLIKARNVLIDKRKKEEYDAWLKIASGEEGGDTFWTVCPYCYYVYEYDRVYRECCLRCQNEECRKVFTAVEVSVPPPEAVAESGRYLCLGFKDVVFKGFTSWSPFVKTGSFEEEEEEEIVDEISKVDGIKVEKMGIKRRKSVGVCAKKVMGKGVRVQISERL